MTSRPGTNALDELTYARTQRLCRLTKVTRQDGFVLRFVDHDRILTFEGETYDPLLAGAFSADRREAAFRSGSQDVRGFADGVAITIPDLKGNLYRGAEVQQILTRWDAPWRVIARHRRFVRSVVRAGQWWTATLEARSQILQRPNGGNLGGTFSPACVFELGDADTCRKDISVGTGFAGVGAAVDAVTKQRYTFDFDAAKWPGSFADDYFRDGSIEWLWGSPEVSSTITAISGGSSLTDSTQAWTVDEHVGKFVWYLTAAGAGTEGESYSRIASNTATTITFVDELPSYGIGKDYAIAPECANVGHVSAIVRYVHATRVCEFLLPTPFDIEVGDAGIWRAGCDGLRGTCRDKFANILNYGGHDVFAPNGQQIVEPAGER